MSKAINNSRVINLPAGLTTSETVSFEQALKAAVAERPGTILLDCSLLGQVSSNHINLLWQANTACREKKIELRLLNPPPTLLRILTVLDLTHTFEFGETVNTSKPRDDWDTLTAELPQTYVMEVAVEAEAIDKAIVKFILFLGKIGAGATTIHELRTIYYEVATNIRQHSGLKAADQIRVVVFADYEKIMMTFEDKGRYFDSTAVDAHVDAGRAAKIRKRRGFGLAMIRRLADRLVYRGGENGGNILTVHKKWCR
ncbi:hypothetical protein TRIP_C20185 [Candidatus Zixiibacteriota bacterium]|nr:hypothetical protein TRIP_C20185 [candidate division Zixibacteria bacterium]